MPFAPHSRVSFGGALVDHTTRVKFDIWSCSVAVINGTIGGGFDDGAYLASIAAPLLAWYEAPASQMSADASLDWVKCNAITANGRYFDQSHTNVYDYDGDLNFGQYNPNDPPIISLALSWGTAKARGPGSHGRIYPPNPTYGTGSSLIVTPVDQANAANVGKALLSVLENSSGPVVVTPVIASGVNATNTPINKVRVGSVKDVQRRRKNALIETYVSTPFS